MDDILQVDQPITFTNDVESLQYHQYSPYNLSGLSNNDEIRITVQKSDVLTLPWQSYLYLEGSLTKDDGSTATVAKFINNAFAFLFEEIRYEINNVEVDSMRNPGVGSTLKSYLSFSPQEWNALENAGLNDPNTSFDAPSSVIDSTTGTFNVIVPLRIMMGFFEDYRRILINVKQELILIRASTDVNAITGESSAQKSKLSLKKVIWNIPHVKVSDMFKLRLFKVIDSSQPLTIPFRAWELHENPNLTASDKLTWHIKTTTQLHKPRYVIIAFHTGKKNQFAKNMSQFDSVTLRNIKLFLNDMQFPYHDLQIDFSQKKISQIYDMYADFQRSYYGRKFPAPVLSRKTFQDSPLIVIDCSKQTEAIHEGTCDIRLEIETKTSIPNGTSCYALILYEKILEYIPISSIVRRP